MRSRQPAHRVRLEPLWLRVERNRLKLVLFVSGFLLVCILAAEVMVLVPLLLFVLLQLRLAELVRPLYEALPAIAAWVAAGAVILGGAYVAITLARPLRRMLPRIGAQRAEEGELLPTKFALKDMAIASGADVAPELFIVDSSSVNAFIAGRRNERPACVVTSGLVKHFDADEQRAVFANLMARLRSGDIAWATAVSALMNPLWVMRDRQFQAGENPMFVAGDRGGRGTYMSTRSSADAGGLIVWALLTYILSVVVTELVALGMRRTHLHASETADAEGMLLLKDPADMLRALRRAIELDNRVRLAVPMYAGLFYIWAGDDLADDDDPEWRRLDRLREVVGIDGVMDAEAELRDVAEVDAALASVLPPEAPALEERRAQAK